MTAFSTWQYRNRAMPLSLPNHPLRLRARRLRRRWRYPRGIRSLMRSRAGGRNSWRPCRGDRRGTVQRNRFAASAWCGRPLWHRVNRRLFSCCRRDVPGCEPGAGLLVSAGRVISRGNRSMRCVLGLRCAAGWRGRSHRAMGLGRARRRLRRGDCRRLKPRGCCRASVHHSRGAHIDRRRGNRTMRAGRKKNQSP
jgi:hypothetical protein